MVIARKAFSAPCFQGDSDIFVMNGQNDTEYVADAEDEKSLCSARIKVKNEFCDYNAKYLADETQYFCLSDVKK
ncbi:hypothetical protein GTPT_1180 [Tatumella ptyseos ATCC 33301]|uniref:Uncharacterized protein n=2 Tax=Tatumella ptyseos TaxID=82987 RepID=A0A085JJK1_9GAMM|nr:hypothetical protein GTPT_1180 [Tatumella ptyseos ATCC 33301]SQK76682.1 D-alanine--D-alanine ligase [Tatumella ptyseos]